MSVHYTRFKRYIKKQLENKNITFTFGKNGATIVDVTEDVNIEFWGATIVYKDGSITMCRTGSVFVQWEPAIEKDMIELIKPYAVIAKLEHME